MSTWVSSLFQIWVHTHIHTHRRWRQCQEHKLLTLVCQGWPVNCVRPPNNLFRSFLTFDFDLLPAFLRAFGLLLDITYPQRPVCAPDPTIQGQIWFVTFFFLLFYSFSSFYSLTTPSPKASSTLSGEWWGLMSTMTEASPT